ncbi:DUF4412 domain-containing protein [Olleya aquimaris]|uniref:Uncharacterized protein n=1 Tax=Olleya aquimaris TaxID=639310 RepID=A0A327R8A9_9FLAO|nr:DUF4412 domain-containing protein [Olleya aquimaris]RAJ11793.1 hypothetical protein LY08_02678 [Olleya aquimaris]
MKKLVFLLLATFSLSVVAQDQLTEGVITSKMTMSSSDEQAKAQFEMIGDIPITTYFKDDKTRSETNNPMSGESVSIIDTEAKKMLTLMNNPMLGKKYLITDIEDSPDNSEVTITKGDETKTILGYECQEYNVEMTQEGVTMTMDFYTTEDIVAANQQTVEFGEEFKGFPLLMTMNVSQGGMDMTITYEVTEVKKEAVADEKFSMTPPEGYEKLEGM